MSDENSSPTLGTCETIKDILAGVPGNVSQGSTDFTPPPGWPVSYDHERDAKLKNKIIIITHLVLLQHKKYNSRELYNSSCFCCSIRRTTA